MCSVKPIHTTPLISALRHLRHAHGIEAGEQLDIIGGGLHRPDAVLARVELERGTAPGEEVVLDLTLRAARPTNEAGVLGSAVELRVVSLDDLSHARRHDVTRDATLDLETRDDQLVETFRARRVDVEAVGDDTRVLPDNAAVLAGTLEGQRRPRVETLRSLERSDHNPLTSTAERLLLQVVAVYARRDTVGVEPEDDVTVRVAIADPQCTLTDLDLDTRCALVAGGALQHRDGEFLLDRVGGRGVEARDDEQDDEHDGLHGEGSSHTGMKRRCNTRAGARGLYGRGRNLMTITLLY